MRYISETALILPTLFAVLATLLTVARQAFPAGGSNHARLKGFEEMLYDLGKTLQKRLPQPPKGPTFILKGRIMGDQYTNFGKAAMGPMPLSTTTGTPGSRQGRVLT
jgi:hypothetical protein